MNCLNCGNPFDNSDWMVIEEGLYCSPACINAGWNSYIQSLEVRPFNLTQPKESGWREIPVGAVKASEE